MFTEFWGEAGTSEFTTPDNNVMHAKPDLRVFLKWMIASSGSVITDVIQTEFMPRSQKLIAAIVFALLAHIVGACVFSTLQSGVIGVLATPIVAFFGWSLLLPIFMVVLMQIEFATASYFSFVRIAAFVVAPSLVFAIVAPKEIGSEIDWFCKYCIVSAIAFSITFRMAAKLKQEQIDNAVLPPDKLNIAD